MLGSYAIVGAHLPMAVGTAWSARLRGTQQVSVAFFGDGATNIGAFHEALNLAAVWKLPVIFVCENNLYMEYTPIAAVTAADHPAADRAPSYRMPAQIVDGNDVIAVHDAIADSGNASAGGRRPDHHRGGDVPALRAQPHRPGHLPPGRGGRTLAQARPARRGPRPAGGARGHPRGHRQGRRSGRRHGRRGGRRREGSATGRYRRSVHRRLGRRRRGMANMSAGKGNRCAGEQRRRAAKGRSGADSGAEVWAEGGAAWRV